MKKIFFIALLLLYIVQIIINSLIVYKSLHRGATLKEWINRLFECHFIVWIPVIGFIIQIVTFIVLIGEKLIKRITNITIK